MTREHTHQCQFGPIQLPPRRQKAAVLVAVGVAQHHFLQIALRRDQRAIHRYREEHVHAVARAL